MKFRTCVLLFFWLTMTSYIESCKWSYYSPLYENEQFERKPIQWRLLGRIWEQAWAYLIYKFGENYNEKAHCVHCKWIDIFAKLSLHVDFRISTRIWMRILHEYAWFCICMQTCIRIKFQVSVFYWWSKTRQSEWCYFGAAGLRWACGQVIHLIFKVISC